MTIDGNKNSKMIKNKDRINDLFSFFKRKGGKAIPTSYEPEWPSAFPFSKQFALVSSFSKQEYALLIKINYLWALGSPGFLSGCHCLAKFLKLFLIC